MEIGKVTAMVADYMVNKTPGMTAKKLCAEIQRDLLYADFFLEWDMAAARVNDLLGYIAGNFPPVVGNKILATFKVRHPFFGSTIPEDAMEAFKIGQAAGEAALQKELEEKVLKKKVAKEAALGFALPALDEPVENETANEILKKMREVREAKEKMASEMTPNSLELQMEQLQMVRKAIESSGFTTLH